MCVAGGCKRIEESVKETLVKYEREREEERVRETQLLLHNRFPASTVPGQNTINTSVRGVSGIRHSATALSGLRRKCPGSFGDGARPRRPSLSSGPFVVLPRRPSSSLLFCAKIKLHMISNVSGPSPRCRSTTSMRLR